MLSKSAILLALVSAMVSASPLPRGADANTGGIARRDPQSVCCDVASVEAGLEDVVDTILKRDPVGRTGGGVDANTGGIAHLLKRDPIGLTGGSVDANTRGIARRNKLLPVDVPVDIELSNIDLNLRKRDPAGPTGNLLDDTRNDVDNLFGDTSQALGDIVNPVINDVENN
ncbi:MAG: hypothetical protein Q9168_002865 [Polycauliona sp. 1 TL-2023]